MSAAPEPLVLQAIDALKKGERRQAAALLKKELDTVSATGDRWRSVSRLAAQIGEIDIAIEASRRSVSPVTLERLLGHWGTLSTYGRSAEAIEEVERLPDSIREHPSVLHFRGTIASERGEFAESEQLFRQALAVNPAAVATWFALAMIKTFADGDPDIAAMEAVASQTSGETPIARARFCYALGKAYDDSGDIDRAFDLYERGAAIRKKTDAYDPAKASAATDQIIGEFTSQAIGALKPSKTDERRAIFVTGVPRSGTTLVEQMLVAHSDVSNGAEINLVRPALIPTVDFTMRGALKYQERVQSDDPWGDIARDYARFLDMRFGPGGRIIDKSLGQTMLLGLILHALPDARVIWLRRNPRDTALSCFRTYFTGPVSWSWTWADIANHFRNEERLIEHWMNLFPDRILVTQYEELVSEPDRTAAQLQAHTNLPAEPVGDFHRSARTVTTASVHQVRQPVSTSRIGQSDAYSARMTEFLAAYDK